MAGNLLLAAVLFLSLCAHARALERPVARAQAQFIESHAAAPEDFGRTADQARRRMGDAPTPVVVDIKALEPRAPAATLAHRPGGAPLSRIDMPGVAPRQAAAEDGAARRAATATLLSAARHGGFALLLIGLTGPLRRPGPRRFDGSAREA